MIEIGKWTEQWVRKEAEPPPLFDPRKERDMYKKIRKELIGSEWIASTSTMPDLYERFPVYNMPPTYDHTDT